MMYYNYGYGPSFGIFDVLWHVIGFLVFVWVVVMLVRVFFGGGRRGRGRWMWETHSALSILNERYAKGEIDKEEFEERRKTLLGQ